MHTGTAHYNFNPFHILLKILNPSVSSGKVILITSALFFNAFYLKFLVTSLTRTSLSASSFQAALRFLPRNVACPKFCPYSSAGNNRFFFSLAVVFFSWCSSSSSLCLSTARSSSSSFRSSSLRSLSDTDESYGVAKTTVSVCSHFALPFDATVKPEYFGVSQNSMDERYMHGLNNYKTPNPKCRLYWSL